MNAPRRGTTPDALSSQIRKALTAEAPALTVILPFYDETAFLAAALRSIRAQRIDGVEVIVVCDNPERFTKAQVAALAATGWPDGPVQVLRHKVNRGLSAARNTGLAAARGDLIAFLDSDDYYVTDGLAAQLDLARRSGADITHAPCYLSEPGSPRLSLLHRDEALHMLPRVTDGMRDAEEAQFIVSSWSSLYARRFLEGEGLRFDEDQPRFEDRLFVLEATTRARKIAYLGQPARVWRRRAGSISVTAVTPETLRLQVQLLEKCLAVIRAEVAARRLPPRFEKRELFNCVSRLIWDMELIPRLGSAPDTETAALGPRVQALLGADSFANAFFEDPMVQKTSRIGMKTRRGRITRLDFFELHRMMREGDWPGAAALLAARAPVPAAPAMPCPPLPGRLVLHLGLHKTGTTFLQHALLSRRDALARARVLLPDTGLAQPDAARPRPGGFPGHQGLLAAHRAGDDTTWKALYREIIAAGCTTTVISCENMLLPTDPARDEVIPALMARLSGFSSVDLVGFGRRADAYAEALYKEWVTDGGRGGARTIEEFLVDHAAALTDWPALFAPWEAAAGVPVRLADFDAWKAEGGLWKGFCTLAGLPDGLPPPSGLPRYPSPDRESTELIRLVNLLTPDRDTRREIIRGYFALNPMPKDRAPLLPPEARAELLRRFSATSADWAAARGYAPDPAPLLTALDAERWQPLPPFEPARLADLLHAGAASPALMTQGSASAPHSPPRAPTPAPRDPKLVIRLRPWARRLLSRWL
ncbi:glycosyltransferase family 2 protein [Vannielia litorea]|uniref:Glycosyltransferase involved in cell wall bisynthesis n=1 Tax=Vannielia litorea TaxID=1217970 RepID=A0A1N6FTW5_9RHOB|nr:glycosyltransferase family 2 protein [Vannielia litorea]SIN98657.1 Glycosyltransferase involved in cell wall bisynthesis [Vannielia litorea]